MKRQSRRGDAKRTPFRPMISPSLDARLSRFFADGTSGEEKDAIARETCRLTEAAQARLDRGPRRGPVRDALYNEWNNEVNSYARMLNDLGLPFTLVTPKAVYTYQPNERGDV